MPDMPIHILIGLLILWALYITPTVIPFRRGHPNRWVIAVVNIVFGATLLGWLAAMVWSLQAVHLSSLLAQSGPSSPLLEPNASGYVPPPEWSNTMKRITICLSVISSLTWPAIGLAQTQPTPSGEDAERNAFQTPTTSSAKQGEPGYSRDRNPLAGSQGPASNTEGKNITEPTGSPTKPSPNSPEK